MDDALKRNLITELGIDKLPVGQQEDILLQSGNIIFQSILNRTIPLLSDKEQTEFEQVLETAKGDRAGEIVFNFLKSKLPNLDTIIKEEIAEFKRQSFDIMSKIGEK